MFLIISQSDSFPEKKSVDDSKSMKITQQTKVKWHYITFYQLPLISNALLRVP